jgi:hypothetical protein
MDVLVATECKRASTDSKGLGFSQDQDCDLYSSSGIEVSANGDRLLALPAQLYHLATYGIAWRRTWRRQLPTDNRASGMIGVLIRIDHEAAFHPSA